MTKKNEWIFFLNGDFHDLSALSRDPGTFRMNIYGGVNEWLDCPNDDFRMNSVYCGGEEDASVVWQIGHELVDLFNGATALFTNQRFKLSIESLWQNDNKVEYVVQSGITGLLGAPTANKADLDREKKFLEKADLRFKLLLLATEQQDVYHILKYLARPTDWVNLYRLLETVESWAKNKSITLGTDSSKRNHFTNTANNFSLSSFDSRHGFKTIAKKNNTPSMTIESALTFVVGVAREYLSSAYFRKP